MDLGTNIYNAFEVVEKTYDNVNKLLEYCRSISAEKGKYTLVTPRFLRYKSDNSIHGWSISSFILLFQNTEDERLESNAWLNGPIYLLEINLYEPNIYDVPMINVAKYEFADMSSWTPGVSPASHHIFYNSLYGDGMDFVQAEDKSFYKGVANDIEYTDRKYWGLRHIVGIGIPLTEITIENAYDKIFGGFDSLN